LWYDKYKATGSLTRKNREQGSYKVKKELVQYAIKRIREKPDIFIKDLLEEVKQKYPDIPISRQHLGRILRNENKTRKRLRHIHQPATYWGKPRDHNKEITDYLAKIQKQPIDKIIALDETAIYASLKGTYGRCSLGKRCAYKTTDNKIFKKYSLLIAINTHGIVGWKLYEEGAVNSERLTAFIAEHITPKYEDNVVIMDNAGFHKTQDVKQEIQKKNQFIYTIPYYPRSNPIENFFSQLKHYIKKESPISYSDINKVIEKSLKNIKEKNYRNYFLYAFDKDSVKKRYVKNSTLKKKPKIYKD
jgi:transposase